MSDTLTEAQVRALRILDQRGPLSSYSARVRLGTMKALHRREMVTSAAMHAASYDPTTRITWTITDKGRAMLRARANGESGDG